MSLDVRRIRSHIIASLNRATVGLFVPLAMITFVPLAFSLPTPMNPLEEEEEGYAPEDLTYFNSVSLGNSS